MFYRSHRTRRHRRRQIPNPNYQSALRQDLSREAVRAVDGMLEILTREGGVGDDVSPEEYVSFAGLDWAEDYAAVGVLIDELAARGIKYFKKDAKRRPRVETAGQKGRTACAAA